EESRDDLQSLGYDTPVPLIRSDSYTTLMDATAAPGPPGAPAGAGALVVPVPRDAPVSPLMRANHRCQVGIFR
ncbi:hypothetical protein, partial [Mycolicibacterium aubagnense]|uniref:hypothetical protein n=1 Tax=Mycolicibacterium aubagnense TaxID=319707 RepID=UPI0019D51D3A